MKCVPHPLSVVSVPLADGGAGASSHRSGRSEVEGLQFDRGGSDAMLREQRVRDKNVCSLCAIILGLSLLQRTRPGVLSHRPRAPREAPRVHRMRVDCRGSFSPEKAGGVTGLLRHAGTKGNGHRGGFPRRAVEAWHVHCCHTLRSGAFDNVRSHRFCTLLGSAQFQSARGPLEPLQCCGVDVV